MGEWPPVQEITDLVWRRDCLCCGRVEVPFAEPGVALCRECACELRSPAERCGDAGGVPLFSAGPYGGAHRAMVLAAKEHVRPEAVAVMGDVLAGVLRHCVTEGVLADPRLSPLVLLPAPTTRAAARGRGGCVVERAALCVADQLGRDGGMVEVVAASHMAGSAEDSVGLDRAQRRAKTTDNLRIDVPRLRPARRILREPGAAACIVDDVTTSGATLSGFVGGLAAHGIAVTAALVASHA